MVQFIDELNGSAFDSGDYDKSKGEKQLDEKTDDELSEYNYRDMTYDSPYSQTNLYQYAKYAKEDYDITPEDIKKSKEYVEEEIDDAMEDVGKTIKENEFLTAKEKKVMKRILYKRLGDIKKSFMQELDISANGFKSWIDDIETELRDKLDEFKDAMSEIIEGDNKSYKIWPKTEKEYKKPEAKNYASDIPVVNSGQRLKVKLDVDSLEEFLCQSDGELENIAMITADNREFKDVENVVFKIAHLDDTIKQRKHAYTEADGKAIADMMGKTGLTKCGWIHTHPFGKTSVFFSGTDDTNTKEMCVFPDDYALAIVVGCKYSSPTTFLKGGNKVVTECDVEWSLGSMLYRKQEPEHDGPAKLGSKPKDMALIKYQVDVEIVDKDGKPIEYENLTQDNSILDSVKPSLTPSVALAIESNPSAYGFGWENCI